MRRVIDPYAAADRLEERERLWGSLMERCPELAASDPFATLRVRRARYGSRVSITLPIATVGKVLARQHAGASEIFSAHVEASS